MKIYMNTMLRLISFLMMMLVDTTNVRAMDSKTYKVFDLTHEVSAEIPTWDGSCGFHAEKTADYDSGFRVFHYELVAGCGTHMDAPCHKIEGGAAISDIRVEELVSPLCIIDVSSKAGPNYTVSVDDIKAYETTFGPIPPGAFVVTYTGWDKHWHTAKQYRAVDEKGDRHFPSISREAASLLIERNVSGIGIDTLSPDTGQNGFPVHEIILGAGKIIVENMTIPKDLPRSGAQSIILPLKIKEGSESPVRAIAILNRN